MLDKYHHVTVTNLSEQCGLFKPQLTTNTLTLDSPALELMVDFSESPAITVNETLSVNDALEVMKSNRIRALMVMDSRNAFMGIVTAIDLMGRKPMCFANEAGIPRADVMVKNVMLTKSQLHAISLDDVKKSRIGDIVCTLRHLREQHILIVDQLTNLMNICGLFSASDFRRSLGIRFDLHPVANTFMDLERVINEHKEVMHV